MLFKRNLSIIVIATLLFTFISTGIATTAFGKSSRVAVITDLTGSATVKSSGSSREYDAYIDMGLAQGDYITTDSSSSVTFKIKDHEDEVTIGSNSVISLTTLTDKGKGKKSKIKVLSGSVWSNVKKLAGGDDFEVETPTAVMAVRGTKVLTSVDSDTGETYVAVAAGTVSAQTNNEDDTNATNADQNVVLIAPSQQLSLDSRDEVNDLENKVKIIDPQDLVNGTSSEIIEAIVKDKADIDRENAEFIAAQKEKIDKGDKSGISRGGADSSLKTGDKDTLDKVAKNLDNLIGNVVNKAIENKKVDKDKIDKIIEDINKNITDPNKKLDLTKVVPMDKTAGVDADLQKAKDAELKKLEDAKKAAADSKKAADDAAKLKLADALKKLQAEADRIAKEKEVLGLIKPKVTTPVTNTPTTVVPTDSGNHSTAPAAPAASVAVSLTPSNFTAYDKSTNLNIVLNNVSVSDDVYGVEVHVVFKKYAFERQEASLTSELFDLSVNSVSSISRYDYIEGSTMDELLFAAVLPGPRLNGFNGKTLVSLPLSFTSYDNQSIVVYVKVVKKSGEVLNIGKEFSSIDVTYTGPTPP